MSEQTTIYDPAKTYRWEVDDLFQLTGQEYGFIYNGLLSKKRELLRDLDILNILEAKLRAAVEAGMAVELTPPQEEVPIVKPTETAA